MISMLWRIQVINCKHLCQKSFTSEPGHLALDGVPVFFFGVTHTLFDIWHILWKDRELQDRCLCHLHHMWLTQPDQFCLVFVIKTTKCSGCSEDWSWCVKGQGPDLDDHANLNDHSGAYHDVQDVQVNSSISMSWRPVWSWCVEGAVHWNQLTLLTTGVPGCSVLGGTHNFFWHSLSIKVRNRYPQMHNFTGILVESFGWFSFWHPITLRGVLSEVR